jgi:hypothetical protein
MHILHRIMQTIIQTTKIRQRAWQGTVLVLSLLFLYHNPEFLPMFPVLPGQLRSLLSRRLGIPLA